MNEKVIKYIEICDYFKELIRNGTIKPSEKLPTEYEIVSQFSVSRHTVRQAIVELEKEGYIYREKGKGAFCANRETSEINENRMVIVITTYMSDYIFPHIIKGIEETLSKEGYDLLLLNTNNQKEREAEHLRKLLNYNVAGAIIEPTASSLENVNEKYYEEINKKNIPYVMINAKYEGLNKSYVVMDDEKVGYLLTSYLIQLGHRNIAGIFKEDDLQGINRRAGYFRALNEHGISINDSIVGSFSTFEENFYPYAFIKNVMCMDNSPTAVVCYNDKMSIQVVKAARECELRIPEDISIVGCDNDSTIASMLEGGLTTIDHPKEKLGKLSAEMLIGLINKREKSIRYVYEPELIIKKSSCKRI